MLNPNEKEDPEIQEQEINQEEESKEEGSQEELENSQDETTCEESEELSDTEAVDDFDKEENFIAELLQENAKIRKPKRSLTKKILARVGIGFGTALLLIFLTLLGTVLLLDHGPSETARNLFVNSAMESSAGKFLATWFLSDDKIKEIRAQNSVVASAEVTDSKLININQDTANAQEQKDAIDIEDISGATYKGKMVIVHDPSRLTVGVSGEYGASYSGKTVREMAEEKSAVVAVNGGGFEDANGMGNGGTPIGIVISDSKLKFGSLSTSYELIGFDKDNKLVVGKMSGQQALDRGVRDAISFGPILIVNGEPSVVNGSGSGLNPRTVIGQRADGAILLAVIDGRQANSLGASYADLVELMLKYGAVNAANLDGGSSTLLYYKGDYINNNSSLYGPRNVPTSILVK